MTASGGTMWVRETIRVASGSLAGVVTSIERRKQLEDQLLRSGRTGALQGMASKLAHDLNNPLMIVTGYAEEMRNTLSDDDPMRSDVEQILSATDRISGITAQLLHYTRRQANPPVPVNVTQALARIEEKIVHEAGEVVRGAYRVTAWGRCGLGNGRGSATRRDCSGADFAGCARMRGSGPIYPSIVGSKR